MPFQYTFFNAKQDALKAPSGFDYCTSAHLLGTRFEKVRLKYSPNPKNKLNRILVFVMK